MKRVLSPQFSVSLLVVAVLMMVSWFALPQQTVNAAAFTTGNIVVYRVGNGSAALAGAVPVFLDEFSPTAAANSAPVQSIAMPTTVDGANKRLVAGTSPFDGALTLSTDNRYLVVAGYDADIGATSPTATSAATVNRVVGLVDGNGIINTTTALTDVPGDNFRTAASSDGSAIWVGSSNGGVRYTTAGSTTSTSVSTNPSAVRQLNIFASQLYGSFNSGTPIGSIGSGLPTSGPQTVTALPGVASADPFGFFVADLSATVPGLDTAYVTDDTANTIRKFSLVSGTWVENGSGVAAPGGNVSVRGLIGAVNGTTVSLYGTTTTMLFSLSDASGYNQPISGTAAALATAATNTAFRGLAFAPDATLAPTATPTNTTVPTDTAIPTDTATPTDIATAIPTVVGTVLPTTTATTTATAIPTVVGTVLPTTTATVSPIPTAVGIPNGVKVHLPLIQR